MLVKWSTSAAVEQGHQRQTGKGWSSAGGSAGEGDADSVVHAAARCPPRSQCQSMGLGTAAFQLRTNTAVVQFRMLLYTLC